MDERKYLLISGIFFLIIAVLHLFRLIFNWHFDIGGYTFPMWVSYFPILIFGILSRWAFKLYTAKG